MATPSPVIFSNATVTGLENYEIAVNYGALSVTRATLTMTVQDSTEIQGEANSAFPASHLSFVHTEGPVLLGGSLSFTTTATAGSLPGVYGVTLGGMTSTNYAIRFVSGSLSVLS